MRWLIDARPLADPVPGGVSRVSRGLIQGLLTQNARQSRHELGLISTGLRTPKLELTHSGPPASHMHLSIPNKLWSLGCMCHCWNVSAAAIDKNPPPDGIFLPNLGFIGQLPIPSILLLHDLSFLIEPRWFKMKARLWHRAIQATRLIRQATFIFAVSEQTRQDTIRLLDVSADRIAVLNLPAPEIFPYSIPSRPPGEPPYVLALGGDDPRKNADLVPLVVSKLNDLLPSNRRLAVKIVGSRRKPRPTDQELAALYAHAAAFLYPSWYEGFGLPLHEAFRYGVPCIASSRGALPETAPPGTVFADPAKPHHWVEALLDAMEQRLPPTSAVSPRTDLSWSNCADDILKKMQELSS